MSDLFEECVNDVGLKFKRRKKPVQMSKQSLSKQTKTVDKAFPPPKKTVFVDLKKSLEKFENLNKENDDKTKKEQIYNENNNKITSINEEKITNYPKLPLKLKLNLNYDYYNKYLLPELRWATLVKDAAKIEFDRVKENFKQNPFFFKQCLFYVNFEIVFIFLVENTKDFVCKTAENRIQLKKNEVNRQIFFF